MDAGDFCIVRGVGLASDLVEEVTRSPWTHILSAIDKTHFLDPIYPVIDERSGVFMADTCHFPVTVDKLTDEEREKISFFLTECVGTHYSLKAFVWAGLSSMVPALRSVRISAEKQIGVVCSTSLAWAYFQAGCLEKLVPDMNIHWTPESVTPAMLAKQWGAK